MLKRVLKFKWHDWAHVWWLFKNMVKQLFLGEWLEAYDAFMWIKIHFSYDSERKDV